MTDDIELGPGERMINLVEIDIQLDKDTIKKLKEIALEEIANDEAALIQYIGRKILTEGVREMIEEENKEG